METYLLPTLSVQNGAAAVEFYVKAFDATIVSSMADPDGNVVAELAIGAARIIVADESPTHGNISPLGQAGVSVRMGLMVANPDEVAANAIAAGAKETYPVADQHYGYRLGHIVDPFGHHWEIGRKLDEHI